LHAEFAPQRATAAFCAISARPEGREAAVSAAAAIKLTERQEITPYNWVHPDDER
jgi:hypothetical protein